MGIFSRFSDIVNSNINSILEKAEDPETKAVFTQVKVKYGAFGNLPESQQLVSKITSNLR